MQKNMVKANSSHLVVLSLKVILLRIKKKVLAVKKISNFIIKTRMNGKKGKCMEKENASNLMVVFMKAIMLKGKKKGLELKSVSIHRPLQLNGKMI